jgi:hypothetical protein
MSGYERKFTKCKCGGELSIFGRKCEKCILSSQSNIIPKKQKTVHISGICTFCNKMLNGEIVDFEGGEAHKSCWKKEIYS